MVRDTATTMATIAATVGTPTNHGNKAACPQGTSPMARDTEKNDDLDIQSLELEIDGNGDAPTEENYQDNIARAISSTRKELFVSASSKSLSKLSGAAKAWCPITPRDTPAQAADASRGATFAAETVFHECSSTPTDGAKTTSKTKRLHGAHLLQAAAMRRPRNPHWLAGPLPLGPSGAGQVGLRSQEA